MGGWSVVVSGITRASGVPFDVRGSATLVGHKVTQSSRNRSFRSQHFKFTESNVHSWSIVINFLFSKLSDSQTPITITIFSCFAFAFACVVLMLFRFFCAFFSFFFSLV